MSKGGTAFKILIKLLSPKKGKENYETKVMKITGEAYKKINLYSKIVSEIVGEDIECGGRMLNYSGRNDGVVRDVYLDYQMAKSDRVWYINDEPAYINYVHQSGMSWAGMWHSHGKYPLGHSGLDDKALKELHKYNKNSKACMLKNEFYTPSIVINRDEYLNEGSYKNYYAEFLMSNGKGHDAKVKDAKLEIIKENNDIMPTLEEMVLEIGEKVKYKRLMLGRIMWGKKLKCFPKYYNILEKYKKIQATQVQGYQDCINPYSFDSSRKRILSKEILDYITIKEVKNETKRFENITRVKKKFTPKYNKYR